MFMLSNKKVISQRRHLMIKISAQKKIKFNSNIKNLKAAKVNKKKSVKKTNN